MQNGTNYILTIGGFDPCNGAGISADIKTLETLGVYALTVITGITIQNEEEIRKVHWLDLHKITEQIDVLMDKYKPQIAKLGVTQDLRTSLEIVRYIIDRQPHIRIIWDPVMVSGSGFSFYREVDRKLLKDILERIYVATPNYPEIEHWSEGNAEDTAKSLSAFTNIYLKGGHHPVQPGIDILFTIQGDRHLLKPVRLSTYSKHGSGCVFASALAGNLALGNDLLLSVRSAKDYTLRFLESDPGLLGIHGHLNFSTRHIEN